MKKPTFKPQTNKDTVTGTSELGTSELVGTSGLSTIFDALIEINNLVIKNESSLGSIQQVNSEIKNETISIGLPSDTGASTLCGLVKTVITKEDSTLEAFNGLSAQIGSSSDTGMSTLFGLINTGMSNDASTLEVLLSALSTQKDLIGLPGESSVTLFSAISTNNDLLSISMNLLNKQLGVVEEQLAEIMSYIGKPSVEAGTSETSGISGASEGQSFFF